MNQLLPQEVVDQIMREEQHFAAAPQAFFEVWKRGVEIAGPQWFGDGTREGLNQAKSKWDLRPDMLRANDALGVLSSGNACSCPPCSASTTRARAVPCSSAATSKDCRTSMVSICNVAR